MDHNHFDVNNFLNEFLNIYSYMVLVKFLPVKNGIYTVRINVLVLCPLLNFFLILVNNYFIFLDFLFNNTNSCSKYVNTLDLFDSQVTYEVYNTLDTNEHLSIFINHVVGIYLCPLYNFFCLENSLLRFFKTNYLVHNFYVKVKTLLISYLYFK